MDTFTKNEQKRLEKLEEMRSAFQAILVAHIGFLATVFVAVLAGCLVFFYQKAKTSSVRYEAQVTLHYQPKQTKNVQPYNSQYVMSILSRQALRRQFANEVNNVNEAQSFSGAHDIKIEQVWKQNDAFVISLASATERDAVGFVNKLAELCTAAYAQERMANLVKLKDVMMEKKNDFAAEMDEITQQLEALNFTMVMVSPERNYEGMQGRLSGERTSLARLEANVKALESKRKALEESKADTYPALLPNIGRIREQQEEIEKIRKELEVARERFTERNPKVVALEKRLAASEQAFHDFLETKGLAVDDLEFLESAPALVKELDQVNEELGALELSLELQRKVVASLENDLKEFNEKYPKRQQLVKQQGKLADAMGKLDETLADINYLEPFVDDELFVGEVATGASEKLPFTKETISLATFGAVMVTGVLAFLVVLLGYRFGTISSEKEVEGLSETRYLGILPNAKSKLDSEVSARIFFSGISHQFNAVEPVPKVVLLGSLAGGEIPPGFVKAFAEDCAGEDEKKVLVLELVEAKRFKIPADRDLHRGALAVYTDAKGYVPVEYVGFLQPKEEAKLRQDVLLLGKKYDLICVVTPGQLPEDGVFLEQVATFCDAAVLAVGMKRTPRRVVRKLNDLQEKNPMKVMTVLSGRVKNC